MSSQAVTWISSLAFMLLLPRFLGFEEYGRFYLAMSLAIISQTIIEFGGTYYIAGEIAKNPKNAPEILAHSLYLRFLLWVLTTTGMVAVAVVAGYDREMGLMIMILCVSKLWEGSSGVLSACFQGFEQMKYSAYGAVVERVVFSGLGVLALIMGAKTMTIVIILGGSTLLNFAVQAKYIRRFVPLLPKVDWVRLRKIFTAGIPFFLWSGCGIIYYRVDAFMLSIMVPSNILGWYGAAYRLFDVLMFLPAILSAALFPVLTKSWAKDESSLARISKKSLDYMLIVGIPFCVGTYFFARPVVSLLFGLEGFGPSVLLLQVLAPGILIVYVNFIFAGALVASGKTRQWAFTAFIAMLINPTMNYFVIPYTQHHYQNGAIGAALATLVTEYAIMCISMAFVPKLLFSVGAIAPQLKTIAAGFAMIVVLGVAGYNNLGLVLSGVAGITTYAVALVLSGALPVSEIKLLVQSLLPERPPQLDLVERSVGT
jgi:O-antigen/teichoic acid export membrane protein